MSYLKVTDAQAPEYMVVAVHTEYEQSVHLFISEKSAWECYEQSKNMGVGHNEVYLTKIIARVE